MQKLPRLFLFIQRRRRIRSPIQQLDIIAVNPQTFRKTAVGRLIESIVKIEIPTLELKKLIRRVLCNTFFQQGGAPTQEALAHSETVIGRIVELFGLDSVGTSDSASDIPALREAIQSKLAG